MPRFSRRSEDNLATCHPLIQRVLNFAVQGGPDFVVTEGHRGREAQDAAVNAGPQ